MCEHDYVVKDGFSDTKSCKITICKKCLEVKNVMIRGDIPKEEKEKSVWDKKDRRIARENALSHATQLAIYCKSPEDSAVRTTLNIAEILENWIYRD